MRGSPYEQKNSSVTCARADRIVALCHADDFYQKKRSWPVSFCLLTANKQKICSDQFIFWTL